MATRIQSHWRGYASRTYIHDFSKRRRYLQEIRRINAATRDVLRKAGMELHSQQSEISEMAKTRSIHARLGKMHHLLSTATRRGTLANIPTQQLDPSLDGKCLESAVKDYFHRCPPQASTKASSSEFRVEETIRVTGPYDHLREEKQLARCVEAQLMALYGKKPFIPICAATAAWTSLPTFAQTQSSNQRSHHYELSS